MRNRIYIPKFDRSVGKKAKSPFRISFRSFPARQSDDVRLHFSGHLCFDRRCLPLFAVQCCVESPLPIASPDILNCSGGCVECYGRFLDGHRFLSILVHSENDVRAQDCPGGHPAGLHYLGKSLALGCRQPYLLLLYRHYRIVLSVAQQRYDYS